mmetsp:Transcript_67498/g.161039  ORF Transcript_67498/g.161039 Transcript_67498/m.161039 type:complete len:204 (-) Transcript_67498:1157-1768(-)
MPGRSFGTASRPGRCASHKPHAMQRWQMIRAVQNTAQQSETKLPATQTLHVIIRRTLTWSTLLHAWPLPAMRATRSDAGSCRDLNVSPRPSAHGASRASKARDALAMAIGLAASRCTKQFLATSATFPTTALVLRKPAFVDGKATARAAWIMWGTTAVSQWWNSKLMMHAWFWLMLMTISVPVTKTSAEAWCMWLPPPTKIAA